jgi:hypothetical protein
MKKIAVILTIIATTICALNSFGAALTPAEKQLLERSAGIKIEPGESFVLSRNFDDLMAQAPDLDIKSPKFDKGKANFWYEQMGKALETAGELCPEDFKTEIQSLNRAAATAFPTNARLQCDARLKSFRALLPKSQQKVPREIETLLKCHLIKAEEDQLKMIEAIEYMTSVAAKLNTELTSLDEANPKKIAAPERAVIAKELRRHEARIRLIIYSPSPVPAILKIRQQIWEYYDKVATRFEAK